MNSIISFFIGLILGLVIFGIYSWILDKINLIKLGYVGSSFIYKIIRKKVCSRIIKNQKP